MHLQRRPARNAKEKGLDPPPSMSLAYKQRYEPSICQVITMCQAMRTFQRWKYQVQGSDNGSVGILFIKCRVRCLARYILLPVPLFLR